MKIEKSKWKKGIIRFKILRKTDKHMSRRIEKMIAKGQMESK
jgi:hypothetical protein